MNPRLSILLRNCPELVCCSADVERAFKMLRDSFVRGGKLLLCGNGGSAADAEHWAGELLKGFCSKRQLSQKEQKILPPELALKLQGALPAIPLTGFTSLSTAFNNDVDPQLTFAQLVWGLGQQGDVLVGLSTSGNAKNVCVAMQAAKARGLACIGLSGQNGGVLKDLCDLCIRVPAAETYRIQEFHLPIYHCLSLMLEDEFFER